MEDKDGNPRTRIEGGGANAHDWTNNIHCRHCYEEGRNSTLYNNAKVTHHDCVNETTRTGIYPGGPNKSDSCINCPIAHWTKVGDLILPFLDTACDTTLHKDKSAAVI